MKTVVVVQARTGSSRLPGKVLMPLSGEPLLLRMVERVGAAHTPSQVVVATTTDASDDPVAELCRSHQIACFRGHPTDLLDRHYRAAQAFGADVVVKIPSDCPLIDPAVIDRVIGHYLANAAAVDFVSNLHPATYPDGNDVEVMPLAVLETAHREATRALEREHTTPFIWEQPTRFRLANVEWELGLDYSMSHRFTIDYAEDYEMIRAVYEALYRSDAAPFSLGDILALLEERPEIAEINRAYAGVNWYRHHLDELRTIDRDQTRAVVGK
ncbi:MAG: glycosyltransferase family protein [Deltaproteobacteria bacterium]|nr:glycosyltransferase family protein [Deltaproteobacteria bacterium]